MTALDRTPTAPLNYDPLAKAIHWTMALLIFFDWGLGLLREAYPLPTRADITFVHKSIGLMIVALLVLRIVWRLTHTAPGHEKTPFEPWATLAAKAGHGVLYLLMIGVLVCGTTTSLFGGHTLPFFGLFEIASPFAVNKALAKQLAEAHELFAHLLVLTAFGHAVVGILHHVVLKDRTLMKMRPFARD